MLKALFKKQFLELNTFYFQDKKTGELRSKKKIISVVLLYALLLVFLAFAFGAMSKSFAPLLYTDTPWLYYAMTGMAAILMGVFGSVFNTYAGMYHAKDNELLLSMPIPSSYILIVRVSGVALMALMYESIVIIPAIIVRFMSAPVTAAVVVLSILLVPVITVVITVITCFLGWIVALLASKFKNKSFMTVLFALVFFALYYYFFAQSYNIIESLVLNSDAVGHTVKTWLYPFYLMGLAGEGDVLSMLLFCLIVAALFALTWLFLTKSFVKITTTKEATVKKVYKEKTVKAAGADKAFLRKELKRFTSSANYMLNAGLGSVFMLVGAVVMLVYRNKLAELLAPLRQMEQLGGLLVIIAVALPVLCAAMNFISAPSVSLEGKNIWIAQSMPVPTATVLKAKEKLHWVITMPPAVLLAACAAYVLELDFTDAVFAVVTVALFVMFTASAGLALNLLKPNLTWTNEVVPVKQSMAALVMIFGGWIVAGGYGVGGYFLLGKMGMTEYTAIFAAVLIIATRLIDRWIFTKGAKIFEEL